MDEGNCIMKNFIILHSSPNVIRVTKSSVIKGRGKYYPCIRLNMCTKFSSENLRDNLGEFGVDERILLKWILQK
jgi:hypothetical protein